VQHSWLTPKAEVRHVGAHGHGSFAVAPIRAGEVVAAFGGHVITGSQLGDFDEGRVSRSIQIADDLYLLGPEQVEDGDLINHSCDPSCGMMGDSVLVARHDLAVGDELTFDYGTCDASPYDEFDCACGAARCRGRVTGDDWRDRDFQMRHSGWFSPYIARRIAAQHGRPGPARP